MQNKIKQALCAAGILLFASSASAGAIYDYERGNGTFGGSSGLSYDSVSASYDTNTADFVWQVDYAGAAADGGWLVVSPGANPKNASDELAIAYFDAASNDVWVYAYNGQNNTASYLDMPFLAYFEDAYSTIGGVGTLAFNATQINAVLETGVAFGDSIGIWFHPSANVSTFGDADGLDSFHASQNGWLDTNWDGDCNNPNNGCITTRPVPEPATALLLLIGLLMIGVARSGTRAFSSSYGLLRLRSEA